MASRKNNLLIPEFIPGIIDLSKDSLALAIGDITAKGKELFIKDVEKFKNIVEDEIQQEVKRRNYSPVSSTITYALSRKLRLALSRYKCKREIKNILKSLEPKLCEKLNSMSLDTGLKESQIRTGVRVVLQHLNDPSKSIMIAAPMQGGKTGTNITVMLLLPVLGKYFRGTNYILYSFLTSHTSFEEQMNVELRHACQMYKHIEANYPDIHHLLDTDVDGSVILEKLGDYYPDGNVNKEIHGTCEEAIATIRRVKGGLDEFRERLEKVHEHGKNTHTKSHVICQIDESHYASNVSGGIAKLYEEVYKSNLKNDVSFMFISATPYELKEYVDNDQIALVKQDMTGENGAVYQGFNFVCGWEFEGKFKNLPIFKFDEYGKMNGFDLSAMGTPSLYTNKDTWEKAGLDEVYEDHDTYREYVRENTKDLMHHFLVDDNEHDGNGAVMRFVNKDETAREFCMDLRNQGLDPSIDMVVINCKVKKKTSLIELDDGLYHATTGKMIKDVIEELREKSDNTKYLIIVTNSARMGAQFPQECKYFIDMTGNKSSTAAAILQGLIGRSCGYGKDSLVLVNSAIYTLLKTQIIPNKGMAGKCCPRTDSTDIDGNPIRNKKAVEYCSAMAGDIAGYHPLLAERMDVLQEAVDDIMWHTTKGTKQKVQGGYQEAYIDIGNIFDVEAVELLEEMLREPHSTDEYNPEKQGVSVHNPKILMANEQGTETDKSSTGFQEYTRLEDQIDAIDEKLNRVRPPSGYTENSGGYQRILDLTKLSKTKRRGYIKCSFRDEVSDGAGGYKPDYKNDHSTMMYRLFLRGYDVNGNALSCKVCVENPDGEWRIRLSDGRPGKRKPTINSYGKIGPEYWQIARISFLLTEKTNEFRTRDIRVPPKKNSAYHHSFHPKGHV